MTSTHKSNARTSYVRTLIEFHDKLRFAPGDSALTEEQQAIAKQTLLGITELIVALVD